MTSKIFALEQRIMNCWNVVDDINDVYNYIGDNEFFTGMDAKHSDKILNLLLGMKELYAVKFEKCFSDFEDVVRVYHSNRKDLETISQKHSEDIQENYVKEIMELKEKLRIATNKQVFDNIEPKTTNKLDELPDNAWPADDQRIDIIGQNGNDGAHYECDHIEIDRLMRINPDCTYDQVKLLRQYLPNAWSDPNQKELDINRFEYITEDGREVVSYAKHTFQLQDDLRTLKVFRQKE